VSEVHEQWLEDIIRLTEQDERKKTDKQRRILEAAIEIFADKGFAAASTSEIAQKAGVAEGTIFRHYKTKKELLLSIAGPIAAKVVAPFLMRDFAKLLDVPYERVDDFFRAVLKDRIVFARKNIKLLRILVHELPFQPELMEQVKRLLTDIVLERMQKLIRHFQERGQLIEAPPWRIIRATVSMFVGLVVFHVVLAPEFPFDEDEEIERTVDLLLYGIAGRQAGPSPPR